MTAPKTSDKWKLQLVQLLAADWLLQPHQVKALLGAFDRELGQEEKLAAAVICYGRLVQPMDMWGDLLEETLKPMQQKQFRDL
jgi:hypothetical protein